MLHRTIYAARLRPLLVVAALAVTLALPASVGALLADSAGWLLLWALVATSLIVGAMVGFRLLLNGMPAVAPPELLKQLRQIGPVQEGGICLRAPTPADGSSVAATIDHEVLEANGMPDGVRRAMRLLCEHPMVALQQGTLVVASRDSPAHVLGVAQFHDYAPDARSAQFGLWLGADARGRGHGVAVIRAASRIAREAGLGSLRLGANKDNLPMQRSFESSGATFIEEAPHCLPDGTAVVATWWRLST